MLADVMVGKKKRGLEREVEGNIESGNLAWVTGDTLIFDPRFSLSQL
jgi:hypothetical protein